ncbi:hypothetical protein MHH52_20995 [Paenibacillus sp. FSL K6-0276]
MIEKSVRFQIPYKYTHLHYGQTLAHLAWNDILRMEQKPGEGEIIHG